MFQSQSKTVVWHALFPARFYDSQKEKEESGPHPHLLSRITKTGAAGLNGLKFIDHRPCFKSGADRKASKAFKAAQCQFA
jgi:hypothetical protein